VPEWGRRALEDLRRDGEDPINDDQVVTGVRETGRRKRMQPHEAGGGGAHNADDDDDANNNNGRQIAIGHLERASLASVLCCSILAGGGGGGVFFLTIKTKLWW
jgi:hypothetical protein